MTKASKQDVEMLKKLVVEFKDELEALGVRVDDLDERVKVLEDRLGGWHMHGQLRLDIRNFGDRNKPTPENDVSMTRARLFFERHFGEDESMFFRARLDNSNDGDKWQQFYVDVPFFFDSTLTVGRFGWDMGAAYYLGGDTALPATGTYAALDSVLTDRNLDGLGFTKQFGLGSVNAYVAHPKASYYEGPGSVFVPSSDSVGGNGTDYFKTTDRTYSAWELFLMAKLQFTEQFGFDIGAQAFLGDNAEATWTNINSGTVGGVSFKNLWTAFVGLRFNFNEHIAIKGIYYHQKWKGDDWNGVRWVDRDEDANKHWRVVVTADQELLKFTSLWLEYGHMDGGFRVPAGLTAGAMFGAATFANNYVMPDDLNYWRVALGQEWNEKWATHLFYFGYDFDRISDLAEWGLGVRYQYNPAVSFGLNYVNVNWKDADNDHVLRFRTQVTF
jgi:hypothetical protein